MRNSRNLYISGRLSLPFVCLSSIEILIHLKNTCMKISRSQIFLFDAAPAFFISISVLTDYSRYTKPWATWRGWQVPIVRKWYKPLLGIIKANAWETQLKKKIIQVFSAFIISKTLHLLLDLSSQVPLKILNVHSFYLYNFHHYLNRNLVSFCANFASTRVWIISLALPIGYLFLVETVVHLNFDWERSGRLDLACEGNSDLFN